MPKPNPQLNVDLEGKSPLQLSEHSNHEDVLNYITGVAAQISSGEFSNPDNLPPELIHKILMIYIRTPRETRQLLMIRSEFLPTNDTELNALLTYLDGILRLVLDHANQVRESQFVNQLREKFLDRTKEALGIEQKLLELIASIDDQTDMRHIAWLYFQLCRFKFNSEEIEQAKTILEKHDQSTLKEFIAGNLDMDDLDYSYRELRNALQYFRRLLIKIAKKLRATD